jgi:hypothetical protein
MQAAVLPKPCNGSVGLEVSVLDLAGLEDGFVDGVRFAKSLPDISDLGFDSFEDIVAGIGNARVCVFRMENGRARRMASSGSKTAG